MSLKLVKIKCTKFSMENLLRSARSSSASIESHAVNAILTPGWDHSSKDPHRPTVPPHFIPWKAPVHTPLIVVLGACSLVDLWSCFEGWLPRPPSPSVAPTQRPFHAPHLHAIHFLKTNFHCFARVYLAVSLSSARTALSLWCATFCCKLHYYYGRLRLEQEQLQCQLQQQQYFSGNVIRGLILP